MKQDYRIFAGAFPGGELAERIQAIRQKYDPVTASITPPHVTLAGAYMRSGPFILKKEAETIHRIEILSGILQPFDLVLNGIRTFPGEHPVVYLAVEVNRGVMEARNLLLSMLGPDTHDDFRPHLTLAMRLPWDKAWEMTSELQDSEWNTQQHAAPIHELRLMQRGPKDKAWACVYTLQL